MRLLRTLSVAALCVTQAFAQASVDPGAFESMIKAGRFGEVQPLLEQYVNQHADSWQAFYQLGYVDFRLHRVQQSIAALCKSILLKTDFAESHKILAFDLNLLGHPELARPELELAIRYDPASFESHYELGRIQYEQGVYTGAVAELETARTLAPQETKVYHNLGLAYAALNNKAAAEESFEKGLVLNRSSAHPSPWPMIDYATYCNQQEQYEKARDLLLQAAAVDDSQDQEFEQLSKALRGLNRLPEAIEALRRAIALNPRKSEFHYSLARLYTQVQRDADAKAELSEYERVRAGAPR